MSSQPSITLPIRTGLDARFPAPPLASIAMGSSPSDTVPNRNGRGPAATGPSEVSIARSFRSKLNRFCSAMAVQS